MILYYNTDIDHAKVILDSNQVLASGLGVYLTVNPESPNMFPFALDFDRVPGTTAVAFQFQIPTNFLTKVVGSQQWLFKEPFLNLWDYQTGLVYYPKSFLVSPYSIQ